MQLIDRVAHRLKLRDLRLLDVVVQSKNMARAAAQLNLTQPAVSKAVSELEHVLGVRLLDRGRQGIEPTPHGRALLRRGIAIFDELRQGVSEIEFLSDPTAGEIRVAASPPITAGILPIVIARMSEKYPRMSIHIAQTPIASLDHRRPQYDGLRSRTVDLVLGQIVEQRSSDLQSEKLFEDHIAVAVGERSKWARRRKIELAELLDEPWCLPPSDTMAGVRCREIFSENDLPVPQKVVESVSIEVPIGLLATQRFLTVLPTSLLQFAATRFSIKPLAIEGTGGRPIAVGIITLKNRTISPAAKIFVDYMRKLTRSLASRR